MNAKKVDSFNEGLDIVFTEEILEKGKSLFSSPADKKIESLEKTLTEQKNAINVVLEKIKNNSRSSEFTIYNDICRTT